MTSRNAVAPRARRRSAAARRWRSAARSATARPGVSRADSPNLAGQYAAVIYKELHDFRPARAPMP